MGMVLQQDWSETSIPAEMWLEYWSDETANTVYALCAVRSAHDCRIAIL